MNQNETPILRKNNVLFLNPEPRWDATPAQTDDLRRWLEQDEVQIIDLNNKRDDVQPTTWHSRARVSD